MAINSKTVLCNGFTMTYYKSLASNRLYMHTINSQSKSATEIYLDRSDVIALHDYLSEMLEYVKSIDESIGEFKPAHFNENK